MSLLRKISRRFMGVGKPAASGRPGSRAYAIGDIHGRLDLLDEILDKIESDAAGRPACETYLIVLGDLIDRGPDSAGVVERLRRYRPDGMTCVFLMGNHEEMLLRILEGDTRPLTSWLAYGGSECLFSYGVAPEALRWIEDDEALRLVRERIPADHIAFLRDFGDTFAFGDYLFVHAGIRPGLPLEEQDRADFRWIREPFLTDSRDHGCIVVHGHTIVPRVEERANRIAIDTGAYRSGLLTAVGIEGDRRWYITAEIQDRDVPAVTVAA